MNALGSFVLTAESNGYFDEANIDVDIQPGSGANNHALLSSGQADFAHVDSAGAMIRYANGDTDFRIVAAVQQNTINALIALESSGISSPPDLEGATVAVAQGTVPETVFPAYAELAGIDADAVEFQYADIPSLFQLLVSGQVDAAGLFVPVAPGVQAAAGEPVVVLPYSEFITDLYGTVIIARTELVESDPDLVRRFVNSLMRGLEDTVNDPDAGAQILSDAEPSINPQGAALQIQAMAPYVLPPDGPVGIMDRTRVAQCAALLQSLSLIPADSDMGSTQEFMAWDVIPGAEAS